MNLLRLFEKSAISHPQNVRRFLAAMDTMAPRAGLGAFGFRNPDGGCYGFVQFIPNSPQSLTIHRLWTLQPGCGNGAAVLRKVCDLADYYGVELTLKTLPFGRKPHPMSREQLIGWYERYGFISSGRKMKRKPQNSELALVAQPSADSGL
jgi:hypothetical protein